MVFRYTVHRTKITYLLYLYYGLSQLTDIIYRKKIVVNGCSKFIINKKFVFRHFIIRKLKKFVYIVLCTNLAKLTFQTFINIQDIKFEQSRVCNVILHKS